MFKKVLIANRGEIAVRVIRACREMGIATVAVYSDVDRSALHVRYADEAYPIGPAPAAESYLRVDKILDVARQAQADAIHPGYGFLAEQAHFAQACADIGVSFIGPPPDAIEVMGDKVTARRAVQTAGVPVVPGTAQGLRDEEIQAEVDRIGYPLLVKAAAGGGGKGMRRVNQASELHIALSTARREAQSSFGDDTVYLEKLIEGARHVEIQLLADTHGNTIYLNERECSIQRRHQKLIEEAPARIVDADLRSRMGQVAVQAAQAVGYVNAGTIEFLVDRHRNFYFLEMNTRLQVEHPVTEAITGVDLVKEQLRVARGRRLRIRQKDIGVNGWAIECRVNAEDPYNNFMPSTGRITSMNVPTGPGVRVDSGVYEGFEISPYYDPMIAKVVSWGETRGEAILRMRRALDEYHILGVKTNIPFHQRIMDSPRFQGGQFDTQFVEERFSMDDLAPEEEGDRLVAAILGSLLAHEKGQAATQIVRRAERDTSNWKWFGRYERVVRL